MARAPQKQDRLIVTLRIEDVRGVLTKVEDRRKEIARVRAAAVR